MKERTNIQNKSLQEEVTIEKQGKLSAESDSISKYWKCQKRYLLKCLRGTLLKLPSGCDDLQSNSQIENWLRHIVK